MTGTGDADKPPDPAGPTDDRAGGSPVADAGAGTGREKVCPAANPQPAEPEEITELAWMRRQIRTAKSGRRSGKVFRKTALHDRPSSVFHLPGSETIPGPGKEFLVPEEMQEFAESVMGRLAGAAEDLYLQVALVDEQVTELDRTFRKTVRQIDRRVAELEKRGRLP